MDLSRSPFAGLARCISEPIDIPETIPNPVVVLKPTPAPTEPAPKEPVRIPEKVPQSRHRWWRAGPSADAVRLRQMAWVAETAKLLPPHALYQQCVPRTYVP